MVAAFYLPALAVLPIAAFLGALVWRARAFSTRTVPADLFRVGTGVAFAAWADPSLGVLACLAAYWWLREGWPRLAGGTLPVLLAAALVIGRAAAPSVLTMAIWAMLAVGVAQAVIAVLQWWGLPICPAGGMVHGTIGHRTGLGLFLAVLLPLSFLTPLGWPLTVAFAVVLWLAPSAVAAVAATAGFLVVFPAFWGVALTGGLALAARRLVTYRPAERPLRRIGLSTVETFTVHRRAIWRCTWDDVWSWPAWLIGHGPGAFAIHTSRWFRTGRLREYYGEAHNDWLEALYEWGVLGLLAVAWWAWRMREAWALGDPLTGATVAFATGMLGSFPLKVAPLAVLALLLAILAMRRVA